MDKIIFNAPINNLSFGNVSFNMLREMYKREMSVVLFPIGDNLNFSSFNKADDDFKNWVSSCANNRLQNIKKDTPCLKMWHLMNSEYRLSKKQFLYTFYELDSPTPSEISITKLQDKTVFSSAYANSVFKRAGCDNTCSIPIGFDSDFYRTEKEYLQDKIHFVLMGKFEKRKHTAKIIKLWAKKFGGDPKYQLSCCVTNPFFKPEQMQQIISNTLEGKRHININFLPYLQSNSEVNELMNSADIDLTGLSGAEGWNLPAFNSTCLGKWSIVLNCTSHKDWATASNSFLIEPSAKEPADDGVFFRKGQEFNQGNIYSFNEDEVVSKMEEASTKCKDRNTEGEKLKDRFNYSNTLDSILEVMSEE
jgi:hypothetical protein